MMSMGEAQTLSGASVFSNSSTSTFPLVFLALLFYDFGGSNRGNAVDKTLLLIRVAGN
jgi:hypothetical protein